MGDGSAKAGTMKGEEQGNGEGGERGQIGGAPLWILGWVG